MVRTIFSLFLLSAGAHTGSAPLPANAKITIEAAHWLPGYGPAYGSCPNGPRLTERKVRQMFKSYHPLAEPEMHDNYVWLGCVTEGDIVVDGRRYRYTARPIHLLSTTWPDGQQHLLGGKPSETKLSD